MRLQHFLYSTFFTLGVATALTGCYDYSELAEEAVSNEAPIVLDLCIGADVHASRAASDRSTRALPSGGEDGDGREMGADFENAVTDLSLYYYRDPSGINATDETTVKLMIHIPNINDVEDMTTTTVGDKIIKHIPLKRSMLDGYSHEFGDQFVVVTNMGKVTTPPTKLKDLRNMEVSRPWTGTGAKSSFSAFVMSNEKNSVYTEKEGTKDDPHIISVDIERVAARLDFCSNGCDRLLGSDGDDASPLFDHAPCIEYTAKDGTAEADKYGKVYVTHVRPFNVMQQTQAPYLIKRSMPTESGTTTYLKDEVPYNSSEFAYVVEQTTWKKKASGNTDEYLDKWFDYTRFSLVDASYASDDNYAVHVSKASGADGFNALKGYSHVNKEEDTTNGFTDFYVLDYANENTMAVGATSHETATGYIVRAVYLPKAVYADADLTSNVTDAYKTDLGKVGNDLFRYRPMETAFSEKDCKYFTSKTVADAYGAKFPAVPFVVEKFENGVCYYITYLRHDNGNDVTPFSPTPTPMEYGIVRNNIYRLKCSFTGPGYNVIPKDPPLKPLGIRPYIFVRKWYQITHPEIEI